MAILVIVTCLVFAVCVSSKRNRPLSVKGFVSKKKAKPVSFTNDQIAKIVCMILTHSLLCLSKYEFGQLPLWWVHSPDLIFISG